MKIRMNPARFCLSIVFSLGCIKAAQGAEHIGHSTVDEAPTSEALWVSAPIAPLLSKGVVVIPFKSEDVKIVPIYGEAAAQVVPRLGHLHVTLDRTSWHWVHADDGPIVLQGLSSGKHQLTLELADAAHRILTSRTVDFIVP